jgi:Flp pilus assembly pilin Flp
MTAFVRAFALVRALLADDSGSTSIRYAFMIGLSASAVLVLVRVGTAVAAAQ